MIDVFVVTELNVLLHLPASLILLNTDVDADSRRRDGMISLEGAEHSVVEVPGVPGRSGSFDGCVVVLLVFFGNTAEQSGSCRDYNGKVAHAQGDASLEGTNDSLPNTGDTNDQDCVCQGGNGRDQRTGKDRNQAEADGGREANVSEDPERSNDQENVGECRRMSRLGKRRKDNQNADR